MASDGFYGGSGRRSEPSRRPQIGTIRWLTGTALLAVVQLAHLLDVLRYSDTASFPGVLADPLALGGIGVATTALVAVAARRPVGTTLALLGGAGIAFGFTLYHGVPIDLGVNNPYWGPSSSGADIIQWVTVIGAVASGPGPPTPPGTSPAPAESIERHAEAASESGWPGLRALRPDGPQLVRPGSDIPSAGSGTVRPVLHRHIVGKLTCSPFRLEPDWLPWLPARLWHGGSPTRPPRTVAGCSLLPFRPLRPAAHAGCRRAPRDDWSQ